MTVREDLFPVHQERVAWSFLRGSRAELAALYHDHIEDDLGPVPPSVKSHVEELTRWPYESYFTYIGRIRDSGDRVAVAVKIADLHDNIARCHGMYGGDVNSERAERYRKALAMLAGYLG